MKFELEALKSINEISEEELSEVVGADGVISTISHECYMNTWQFIFTCC
ncbi:lacticin 481 family lantibiotic [Terribacillus saccharophilus]|uniref:Lantibiotic n=1 Tax=Terribacillus saccharophilus TaxID=361277 RepID=A0A268AGA1_9BACI|nr:lacticin 481 family lantibiotic [Terribacillus saccharophilus]PAD23141.1 lantibiotic lacticin [Terribacillus saccharophilus]